MKKPPPLGVAVALTMALILTDPAAGMPVNETLRADGLSGGFLLEGFGHPFLGDPDPGVFRLLLGQRGTAGAGALDGSLHYSVPRPGNYRLHLDGTAAGTISSAPMMTRTYNQQLVYEGPLFPGPGSTGVTLDLDFDDLTLGDTGSFAVGMDDFSRLVAMMTGAGTLPAPGVGTVKVDWEAGPDYLDIQATETVTAGYGFETLLRLADLNGFPDGRIDGRFASDLTLEATRLGGAGGPPVMPDLGSDPATGFDFTLALDASGLGVDTPLYIDPEVAIGYTYEVFSGPNFASVVLPDVGDGLYDLYLPDVMGNWVLETVMLDHGVEHVFGPGGVSSFRILGIEPRAGLSPTDPHAFVTGLTFVTPPAVTLAAAGGSLVSMSQTPITLHVPEPGAVALLGLGLTALVVVVRRRR